jgi:hypothetical protein
MKQFITELLELYPHLIGDDIKIINLTTDAKKFAKVVKEMCSIIHSGSGNYMEACRQ